MRKASLHNTTLQLSPLDYEHPATCVPYRPLLKTKPRRTRLLREKNLGLALLHEVV